MKRLSLIGGGLALAAGIGMIAGCAPSPPPPPPPAPAPTPAPPPPPPSPAPPVSGDWRDTPLAPGTWVYRADERGSLALFGPENAGATFVIRCEMPARRIVLSRAGELPGREGTMSFQASNGTRSYTVQGSQSGPPYAVAVTNAQDGWLDELAFTRGRFTVSVTGMPVIALPNWPQMVRVVEDCRG